MTIFFPDLSHFNSCDIQIDTAAAICKATQGSTLLDPKYGMYRDQAKALGVYFMAYHWLNAGNYIAQANFCFARVGKTPLMIDAEDVHGNTGYTRILTVDDILGFTSEYRHAGGIVSLVYLPHWYWQNNMGSPDLTPLTQAGLSLVSSNYRTYSETGAGWASYGGMTPVLWQYSSSFPYGGDTRVDFNAYRGTIEDFKALTSGTIIGPISKGGTMLIAKDGATGQLYLCDGLTSRPINASALGDLMYLANQGLVTLGRGTPGPEWDSSGMIRLGWAEASFGTVQASSPVAVSITEQQIQDAVRAVLHNA